MAKHYHTSDNKTLCEQKCKNHILSESRFSYEIGRKENCKKCDKILMKNIKESNNECSSFKQLGYTSACQWRSNDDKCNCIDDCAFKKALAKNI